MEREREEGEVPTATGKEEEAVAAATKYALHLFFACFLFSNKIHVVWFFSSLHFFFTYFYSPIRCPVCVFLLPFFRNLFVLSKTGQSWIQPPYPNLISPYPVPVSYCIGTGDGLNHVSGYYRIYQSGKALGIVT